MILNILLLIIGFVALIKGADIFVDGASNLALNFKVPKILIGLTIVAFGTSAPEFAVSMSALSSNSSEMVLGNVIGSNITNALLILGVASTLHPILLKENTVKKELPLSLLISTLLVVLFLDVRLSNAQINQITRSDGIVIILFFSIFVYYLLSIAKKNKKDEEEKAQYGIIKSLIFLLAGLLFIIVGSNAVVKNAKEIAEILGVSERIISLTIIAFGTSLPELVTTIISSKKGEQDLLLGNIIGSNIFNICIVLGIPVTIYGNITPGSFNPIDLAYLIFSSLLLYIFAKTKKGLDKQEGIIMIISFFIYYTLVFII